MADNMKTHKIGLGLEPQSSEPSNPKAGDLFISDGTARAQGLWQFNGTDWLFVGAGISDKSVYAQFDAEDKSTTGFTNISVSSSSPINQENSYSVDSLTASLPAVTIPDRSKSILNAMQLHYKMTSGTAKLVVKDQATNVLAEREISSTSIEKVVLQYYLNSTVTSIQLEIQDVSSATGVVLDDIIFTDEPFVTSNLLVDQGAELSGSVNEGSTNARIAYFPTTEHTLPGSLFSVTSNSTDGTSITALEDCIVNVSLMMNDVGSTLAYAVCKNLVGAELTTGSNPSIDQTKIMVAASSVSGTANGTGASTELFLQAGDILYPRVSAAIVTPSTRNRFIISARANSTSVVSRINANFENQHSAKIANNGTASIISQDSDIIASVSRTATGTVDVTFKAGVFTQAPALAVVTTSGGANRNAAVDAVSTSAATIRTQNTSADTSVDADFDLVITRQGIDHIPMAGTFLTPVALVTHISDIQPNGTDAHSAAVFSTGSWVTRELNTVDGDQNFPLSSNQFTLPAGKYFIQAHAPAFACGDHKLRLRNITDSTTDIVGRNARATDAGGAGNGENDAELSGVITLSDTKVFELQHRCIVTSPTRGFGRSTSFGEDEVYAQVVIQKLS